MADRVIGTAVEACAAALVAAEVIVLFVGVVSRYVFHSPIVWSDELASFLFLWLAMLGSVVAYRNAEHMRMTALVSKSSRGVQTFFDAFAGVASIAFLLLTIGPAFEFAHEEVMITTPALEISGAWRASALPVGLALMLVTGIISVLRSAHRMRCAFDLPIRERAGFALGHSFQGTQNRRSQIGFGPSELDLC
jgi:TRAP-type C4-dicarboxylate transport system permease small subunit